MHTFIYVPQMVDLQIAFEIRKWVRAVVQVIAAIGFICWKPWGGTEDGEDTQKFDRRRDLTAGVLILRLEDLEGTHVFIKSREEKETLAHRCMAQATSYGYSHSCCGRNCPSLAPPAMFCPQTIKQSALHSGREINFSHSFHFMCLVQNGKRDMVWWHPLRKR